MVTVLPFGQCPDGAVHLIVLDNGDGLRVELLSLGAAVRSISAPGRDGAPVDVCLGYDSAEEYLRQDACLGACVGRCANRIAGARFTLDGREWPLTANEGPNHLHGGLRGFDKRLWAFATGDGSVTFQLLSPHLEEGYPGALRVEVTYALSAPGRLDISYRAAADRDTVVNLTNHSYFNLSGHGSGPVLDQVLTLRAERYTPCGSGNLPTGALAPVEGTPLDLRRPTCLGGRLEDPLLAPTRGFDHNFVLNASAGEPAALLWSPRTGIALEVETTLEGMQLYTAGFLSARRGKEGALYGPGHAVCLETQHFPDAVHHPAFPSPVLRAGETYDQRTSYRFFLQD